MAVASDRDVEDKMMYLYTCILKIEYTWGHGRGRGRGCGRGRGRGRGEIAVNIYINISLPDTGSYSLITLIPIRNNVIGIMCIVCYSQFSFIHIGTAFST